LRIGKIRNKRLFRGGGDRRSRRNGGVQRVYRGGTTKRQKPAAETTRSKGGWGTDLGGRKVGSRAEELNTAWNFDGEQA